MHLHPSDGKEAEIWRIMVPGQSRQKKKFMRTPSQWKKAGCGRAMPVIPATAKVIK
jgi:hypothetical protein